MWFSLYLFVLLPAFTLFLSMPSKSRQTRRSVQWTVDEEAALIDLVHQENSLWNKKDPKYLDNSIRNDLWNVIAARLSKPSKLQL